MEQAYDGLITFESTHQALRMEAALDEKKMNFDVRPIPPAISAGCGLAIEFFLCQLDFIAEVVGTYQIVYQGLYKKNGQQFIEIQRV